MTTTTSRPADSRLFMTVEEYLRTSFEDADRDFVDGEVFERNMGELPHATVQAEVLYRLRSMGEDLGLRVLPEIRTQVARTRFRVADVAVWPPGDIGSKIPTVPPFLVVEVLSAEDRLVRLQPKIQDYLRYGVAWVWVIDPDERRAMVYSPADPTGSLVEELRTENPVLVIGLNDLLSALDPPTAQ
jgi:Uma2 family endonuclease